MLQYSSPVEKICELNYMLLLRLVLHIALSIKCLAGSGLGKSMLYSSGEKA